MIITPEPLPDNTPETPSVCSESDEEALEQILQTHKTTLDLEQKELPLSLKKRRSALASKQETGE